MLRKGLANVVVDVCLELVSRSGIAHFDGVCVVVHIYDFYGHCDFH